MRNIVFIIIVAIAVIIITGIGGLASSRSVPTPVMTEGVR